MIQVLLSFCKNGKHYKKGDKVSFSDNDEKILVSSGFAEFVKPKKTKK
jgi:hypothetical protein